MSGLYVRGDDGTVRPEPDLLRWAKWHRDADLTVAATVFHAGGVRVRVSTVFLGIDHRYGGGGPPLLFETMIFGGPDDLHQARYATEAEAHEGHAEAVRIALGSAPAD